jgi:hypothetical protein
MSAVPSSSAPSSIRIFERGWNDAIVGADAGESSGQSPNVLHYVVSGTRGAETIRGRTLLTRECREMFEALAAMPSKTVVVMNQIDTLQAFPGCDAGKVQQRTANKMKDLMSEASKNGRNAFEILGLAAEPALLAHLLEKTGGNDEVEPARTIAETYPGMLPETVPLDPSLWNDRGRRLAVESVETASNYGAEMDLFTSSNFGLRVEQFLEIVGENLECHGGRHQTLDLEVGLEAIRRRVADFDVSA